ncbi:MAG: deoxyribonuclease IV [SAR202 cluster bacterium]|nr:deoxyribonuclease IV [SAR202 cluster bacterium]
MKLGAHVSTSGGLSRSIDRAQAIGAEAIQIFASSPRAWKFNFPKEEEIALFKEKSLETGIGPCYIHGSYLVNIGGDESQLEKSIESLTNNMITAGNIGAEGVIFHGGSHKGRGFNTVLDQAVKCLIAVLEESPNDTWLCIENSAGMGSHIGSSFDEIGAIIKAVNHPNLKVCLDTEHCFAAGYNIASRDDIDSIMEEFDSKIGLERLVAVHANDAKVEFGSGVDRHENIGEGYIGEEGFEVILANPAFSQVPFFLEVPGFDGEGPDKENINRLKSIRNKVLEE